MTHPLRAYLDKHEITESEFADKVTQLGVTMTTSYVSQIVIGYRKPGSALAVAIADATNKAVTVDDLLRYERAPRRRRNRAA